VTGAGGEEGRQRRYSDTLSVNCQG
jgi:hypothetical protein